MAYRIQRRHPRMSGGFPACAVAAGRWRAGLAAPAIAAPLLAASVLAPSGVTATIQGYPVCLPVTAQPGSTYTLSVAASPGTLSVGPAHGTLERTLRQVPPSWVSFGPGSPAQVRLSVPSGAATGAYWSDITVTSASGGSGQVQNHTAGTAALVFTVGPSATPPPPCGALDEAYSTGRFPSWPTQAFATTGWYTGPKPVFARQRSARSAPEDTCPTATSGPAASAAPSYCPGAGSGQAAAPAYSPAASTSGGVSLNMDGWVVLAVLAVLGVAMLARRRRS